MTQNAKSSKPPRRFRFHLSTAVVAMVVAALLLGWQLRNVVVPEADLISPWVSSEGLAIRLSTKRTKVTVSEWGEFTLELRNDTANPLAVLTSSQNSAVWIHELHGKRVEAGIARLMKFVEYDANQFTVLVPGTIHQYRLDLYLEGDGKMQLESGSGIFQMVSSGTYHARSVYYGLERDYYEEEKGSGAWAELEQALNARVWQGQIVGDPVVIHITPQKTPIRMALEIMVCFVLVVGIAGVCELWIRSLVPCVAAKRASEQMM